MICYHLINKCNWDCDYCISGTQRRYNHKKIRREIDFFKTLKDLETLSKELADNKEALVLSGGEPGLLPINELLKIFEVIDKRVELSINTNSLLLEKIINNMELEKKVKSFNLNIRWHFLENSTDIISESSNKTKNYLLSKFKKYYSFWQNLEYQLILTERDLETQILLKKEFLLFFEDFKKQNPNFKLVLTPDLNIKNHMLVLKNLKIIKEYNFKNNIDLIDIEASLVCFNTILNFQKKEDIKFRNSRNCN